MSNTSKDIQLTFVYKLSPKGQIESLKAGGDGKEFQVSTETLPVNSPHVEFLRVDSQGRAFFNFHAGDLISSAGLSSAISGLAGARLKDHAPNVAAWWEKQRSFDAPLTFAKATDMLATEIWEREQAAKQREALAARFIAATDRSAFKIEYESLGEQRITDELYSAIFANKEEVGRLASEEVAARKERARAADREAAIARFLADESLIPGYGHGSYTGMDFTETSVLSLSAVTAVGQHKFQPTDPVTIEARRRWLAKVTPEREAKARKEQAEREAEEQKAKQIADWVRDFGSESQKARFAEGVLPISEVVARLKGTAFEPLDAAGWKPYQKITKGDVRETCSSNCPCSWNDDSGACDVSFRSEPVAEWSEAEWAQVAEARRLLPGAEIEISEHRGVCDSDDCAYKQDEGIVRRRAVRVAVTVGGFTFNGLYEVGAESE